MAEDPATLLEQIRERAHELTLGEYQEDHCGAEPCTGHDALRLAAAVEAVLKEADEFEESRPERLVTRSYAAECFRAAITRSLTGEEDSDGQ